MTESRSKGNEDRSRDLETRETEKRPTPWKPAPLLPNPNPREGLDFRYVRVSMRGVADNVNASQAFREGWEPVLSADYPELKVVSDRGSDYPDNVVVGGLLLCARPSEIGEQIAEYAQREMRTQMDAVDQNYFREQDSRMPLLRPERSSRVTFGDD
jgi:hypothetical protein